jgi:hypothetical protein
MGAKRLYPVSGILTKGRDEAFGPVFLAFRQPYIYDISGNGALNKHHLTIHPCKGFAFCGIILYQDIG